MNLDLPSKLYWRGFCPKEKDSLFLSALYCRNNFFRPPVWIMRQAGRYLDSYQRIRKRYALEDMFRSPELIVEITKLPIEELGMDAAILFADILHVALPLGCQVTFPNKKGPVLSPILQREEDILRLSLSPVHEELFFVKEAIIQLKKELSCPLIGFAGGPFTIAYYLTAKKAKAWMYKEEKGFHRLLEMITEATIFYLNLQIEAGVDAIQIFDSWANCLPRKEFTRFALPYLQRILHAFEETPIILYCRSASLFVKELITLQPQGISFEETEPLWKLRLQVPKTIAVQGNIDPYLLYASKATIKQEVRKLLNQMRGDPGFIVNLGHGILPDIPVDNVRALIEEVKREPSL